MKTEKITQIYFNHSVEEYFNYPNLCNSSLHDLCINELEYKVVVYDLVTLHN